jgi:hypothetical protein
MARSPVFERTCEELEQRTSLDRLASRGTVRIALRVAGLDPESVDAAQMAVVLGRVLSQELEGRGVAEVERICSEIAAVISAQTFEVPSDRAGAAAKAIARFGS